jgi:hypothetical protein
VTPLGKETILPHQPALTFFYGPVALARDIRVTEGDVRAPVAFSLNQKVDINHFSSPKDIWKTFELDFGQGGKK